MNVQNLHREIDLLKKKVERERKARKISEELLEEKARSLYQANQELEKSLEKQRDQQMMMIHSEKMASLGVMSAGIAHEINTPLQFIGDNLVFLDDMFREFMVCVRSLNEDLKKTKFFEILDVNYLMEEVPVSITESLEGYERLQTIVKAMKSFVHPDDEKKSTIDINQIIENAVIVSNNQVKFFSEVEMTLNRNLPDIMAFEGELKQVILNLIINSSHAIKEENKRKNRDLGLISIKTSFDDNYVHIFIKDNGGGIPEKIHKKIFNPFFTTKDVGVGTGQGLAISKNIIEKKHKGSISFKSHEGVGTTFLIKLPRGDKNE